MTVIDSVRHSIRHGHRGLYLLAVVMTALTGLLILGALVDHRIVDGAPVWFKPIKFAVSIATYAAAWSWLIDRAALKGRLVRFCAGLTVLTLSLEMVAIVGQAARGQGSHFNHHGTFAIAVSSAMGGTIAVFFLGTVTLAVAAIRTGRLDPLMRRAVTAGVLLSLAGMSAGIVMSFHGAHTVGARDGGPGLPFTGWSTTAGDLRIPHFVGLHGLELMPLLAIVLAWFGRSRWARTTQLRLLNALIVGYVGVFVILFAQALRGESLVHPSLVTLSAAVLLLAVVATGVAHGLRPARQPVSAAVR